MGNLYKKQRTWVQMSQQDSPKQGRREAEKGKAWPSPPACLCNKYKIQIMLTAQVMDLNNLCDTR